MMAVLLKELRSRKWAVLAYCLIGTGLVLLYISMFPSIQRQAANFTRLLDTLPKGYLTAFGAEGAGFETLESYLSIELFSLVWPLMAILLMFSWGGSALAGEIERGTMGSLLSQPLRRSHIYVAKFYAGLLALAAFIVCSLLTALPLARIFSISLATRNVLAAAILCYLFGAALLGASMLVSAMVSERSKVYFIAGGLLLIMYVANIIAGVNSGLTWLANFSLFHYFDAGAALRTATLDQKSCLILLAVSLLTAMSGGFWFRRRDITA